MRVLAEQPVLWFLRATGQGRNVGCALQGRSITNATALYRVLVDAGAKEDLAKEAAESVVYSPEGATKSDLKEVRTKLETDIAELRAELKGDIAGLELRIERSLRTMTWRFVGLMLATQALLFAGLRLTGTS